MSDWNDKKILESYKKVYDYLKNPPTNSSELYDWIYHFTGEKVPFKPVCSDHQTPWDLIWRSYRIDFPKWRLKTKRTLIAMGPRNGQKTLSEAKLISSELLLKPNCGIIGMGAVLQQADRCYAYVSRYIRHPVIQQTDYIQKMIKTKMEMRNGSFYEQACATLAGVNSQHVPKMMVDEVDLVKPEVLEESKMIPASRGDLTAHTLYTSTRKFYDGPMQGLIEEGRLRDYDCITWCYKEVSEPCPTSRRGTKEQIYHVEDIYNPGETVVVKAYEGCKDCPLLKSCRGDLANAKGNVPIEDTMNDFLSLDIETWLAQKECKVPKRRNLFFADWSRALNAGEEFAYNPNLPLDLSFDFTNGGDSPTACEFWQEDELGNNYLLACRSYVRKSTMEVARDIKQFAADIGIRSKPQMQVGDSAQMQYIKDLNEYEPDFFHVQPTKKTLRKEGWPLCRRQVRDTTGRRRLKVNPRYCQEFIHEIENATRSTRDADDIGKQCATHFLDAFRYREVKYRLQSGEPNIRLLIDEEPKQRGDGTIIVPPANEGDNRSFFDRCMDYDDDL